MLSHRDCVADGPLMCGCRPHSQSATKGAITTFTKSLATQILPKGIRVVGVACVPSFPLAALLFLETHLSNAHRTQSRTRLHPAPACLASQGADGGLERRLVVAHSRPRRAAGRVGRGTSDYASHASLSCVHKPVAGEVDAKIPDVQSYVYCATSEILTGQVVHPNSVRFSLIPANCAPRATKSSPSRA